MKSWAQLATLGVLVLVAHWPAGTADFTFDDKDYIGRNTSILSLQTALGAFDAPFPPHRPDLGLYRPLTNLTYAVDVALWGADPFGFHAINVVLYLVTVWAVLGLCRRYPAPPGFAFAAALLFAVHPVHCEAVDSVTGRSEVLALLFSVLSMRCFMGVLSASRTAGVDPAPLGPLRSGGTLLPLALVAYALACLSKETGAVVPGVLLIHFLAFGLRPGESGRQRFARGAALLAPFAAVAVLYLVVRIDALGSFAPGTPVIPVGAVGTRIHAVGVALYQYAGLLVLPRVLQVDFYWERAFLDPATWRLQSGIGWILLGTTLGLLWRFLPDLLRPEPTDAAGASERRRLVKVGWCGIATCGVFLLPVSHAIPIGAYMAERFLFAPSFGFCVFAAALGLGLLRSGLPDPRIRARVAVAVLVLLTAAGTLRSRLRADEWRDELALWRAAERALPGDSRVFASQASAYLERGRYPEARRAVRRARQSEPRLEALDRLLAEYERTLRRRTDR